MRRGLCEWRITRYFTAKQRAVGKTIKGIHSVVYNDFDRPVKMYILFYLSEFSFMIIFSTLGASAMEKSPKTVAMLARAMLPAHSAQNLVLMTLECPQVPSSSLR